MPFFKKSSSKFPHLQLNQPDPVPATYQHHHRLDQSDNTTTTTTHYFHPAHQPESPRKSTDINTTRNTNTRWSTSPTSIPTDPNKDIRGNPENKDRGQGEGPAPAVIYLYLHHGKRTPRLPRPLLIYPSSSPLRPIRGSSAEACHCRTRTGPDRTGDNPAVEHRFLT